MKRILFGVMMGSLGCLLSSCFLVSIPVKATGEIIEKSAQATGRAANRGIHRATTPSRGGEGVDYSAPAGETYDEYGYPE